MPRFFPSKSCCPNSCQELTGALQDFQVRNSSCLGGVPDTTGCFKDDQSATQTRHDIHGTGIYAAPIDPDFKHPHVCKYASPMDVVSGLQAVWAIFSHLQSHTYIVLY